MPTLKQTVDDFLAQKRIAVAGVSRSSAEAANLVYRKLRDAGYEVFPINPNANEIEGDACYPNVKGIPGGVDGIVIATHPDMTEQVVRECAEAGVSRIWIHRSFGKGSVSQQAVDTCRNNSIAVIPGGCPLMFRDPVDFGHKCMRWILNLTGGLPKQV